MTTPIDPQATQPQPALTQTHTWIYLAGVTLSSVFAAFAPKIQHYAAAHPTGAIVVGSLLGALGTAFPSVLGQSTPPNSP